MTTSKTKTKLKKDFDDSRIGYFDKKGKKISFEKWCKLCNDSDYRQIKLTRLPNKVRVSTVWLGLDHRFSGGGKPIIFETLALSDSGRDWGGRRACTEKQALKDHEEIILEAKKVKIGEVVAEEL